MLAALVLKGAGITRDDGCVSEQANVCQLVKCRFDPGGGTLYFR